MKTKSWGSNTYIRQNRTKPITMNKGGHYIIIKGAVQQENITLVNIYAPNIGALKYIRKIFKYFKKEITSNTVIIGDFNIPLSRRNRSSK